jgi:ribosome-associated translation inhibitor RaiA
LRLGGGLGDSDRERVLADLEGLAHHLSGWRPEQVDVEVSVKDRSSAQQRVTLNAWLMGWPHLVATFSDNDLDHAVRQARKELIRQIEGERDRQKPHRRRTKPAH